MSESSQLAASIQRMRMTEAKEEEQQQQQEQQPQQPDDGAAAQASTAVAPSDTHAFGSVAPFGFAAPLDPAVYAHLLQAQMMQAQAASTASLLPAQRSGGRPLGGSGGSSVSLLRGPLSLRERVEQTNLAAHHAALRRAAPAVQSRPAAGAHGHGAAAAGRGECDASLYAQVQANHAATVARQANMKAAEIARRNAAMVGKITRTVLQAPGPYGQAVVNSTSGVGSTTPYRGSKQARPFVHRSLNLARRRAEQARIAQENLVLARRIIERKPRVAAPGEWDTHASTHGAIRNNISRYIEVPQAAAQAQAYQPGIVPTPQAYAAAAAAAAAAATGGVVAPLALPPGYGGMDAFTQQQQQLYFHHMQLQAQAQMQAQAQAMGHPGFAPGVFHPSPPSYPRGSTPSSAAGVSSSAGGGGPLAPLPDAQKRSARLHRKMIAAEKEKFAPSPATERLLRPLRHSGMPMQPHPRDSGVGASADDGQSYPHFQQANLAQLHASSLPHSRGSSASASVAASPAMTSRSRPRSRGPTSPLATDSRAAAAAGPAAVVEDGSAPHHADADSLTAAVAPPQSSADAVAASTSAPATVQATADDEPFIIAPVDEPILIIRKAAAPTTNATRSDA